ncbi:3-oxoacyl-ACP synthase III family protein [Kitasatospora viridis]|uniref:3-oxoacyl-[acyl-carrier-protein] synthase-3 n=1 Tax=Kitasatospora viridis TaxID=281105 RepID=A0A561UCB2_9ACTN|nr:3-oxoacyl-[acyl-carrier-protein] synthase III C-terminal domain-containing protein [Kitasatospora viridis]TWF97001.1 3-oxoacyl-[acyl-carrier-protein] synthase-3 [Kitasatospora viridis]
MTTNQFADFGIAGFGYSLGADQKVGTEVLTEFVDDPERVLQWGYRTFHRAPEEVTAIELSAKAALAAIEDAGLTVEDVDYVVLALSDVPGYLNWDASSALAHEIGVRLKPNLLLMEGCVSGVTGLGNVAGLFATDPTLRNVLFVAVNRVSEFHRNRMRVNNSIHSDGASAVVLRRGHDFGRWLTTVQFTDPDVSYWFRTEYGGEVAPVAPADWSSKTEANGLEAVVNHFRTDPKGLQEFVAALNRRLVEVTDQACERAGVTRDSLKKIIHLNDNQGSFEEIAEAFDVPIDRTSAEIAAQHGHMGAADHLVTLAEYCRSGELVPGDLVALIGISIGMRWYCTLVRI